MKQIWENEYKEGNIPTSVSYRPSRSIPIFIKFLKKNNIPCSGKLLEIGCGRGRNGLRLAELGFEIFGIDVATNALNDYCRAVKRAHLEKHIHLFNKMINPLPFSDAFFDFGVDIELLFELGTNAAVRNYVKEVHRVLKKGAYLLEYQLDPKDSYYSMLPTDKNGFFVDEDGAPGRLYNTHQIEKLLSFGFKPVYSKTLVFNDRSYDIMYGKPYKRTLSLVILKKK